MSTTASSNFELNDLRRSGEFYAPRFGRSMRKDKAPAEEVQHSCTWAVLVLRSSSYLLTSRQFLHIKMVNVV